MMIANWPIVNRWTNLHYGQVFYKTWGVTLHANKPFQRRELSLERPIPKKSPIPRTICILSNIVHLSPFAIRQ